MGVVSARSEEEKKNQLLVYLPHGNEAIYWPDNKFCMI